MWTDDPIERKTIQGMEESDLDRLELSLVAQWVKLPRGMPKFKPNCFISNAPFLLMHTCKAADDGAKCLDYALHMADGDGVPAFWLCPGNVDCENLVTEPLHEWPFSTSLPIHSPLLSPKLSNRWKSLNKHF